MPKDPIGLEQTPKDENYEDYICAYLQSSGLYVEKSIIYRGKADLLELDIISSDFTNTGSKRLIVEIKSGDWGFSDVFKVKGWMDFLGLTNGAFIVQESRDHMDFYQSKASELSISLINDNLQQTQLALAPITPGHSDQNVINSLRFSYSLERKLLREIKSKKKNEPNLKSYKNLNDYVFLLNSSSFFTVSPLARINTLFEAYINHKNISSKLAYELAEGEYRDDIADLSEEAYWNAFYYCTDYSIYPALYVEHQVRLTILKCCIEYLVNDSQRNVDAFIDALNYHSLPNNIKSGLKSIVQESHFHRYPIFWQFFTYVMGGFILTRFEQNEYEYLSTHTGVPVDQIPNAFDAFNKLFPTKDGWMFNIPKSEVVWHKFFPLPFSGIGSNHRRIIYTGGNTYADLNKMLVDMYTCKDLAKWNQIAYKVLKS